jgi:uridine kinase
MTMNKIDYITLLNRSDDVNKMREALNAFKNNSDDLLQKRGIYIYGAPGSGKTYFVKKVLEEFDYDIVYYDAGDIRNKGVMNNITNDNMSNRNVISMFQTEASPIAVVMDEIDGMNSGDKGGINSLIKLIRPKKTKKQKTEDSTNNPIICISNYHLDKKIKELMKVCVTIELKTPNESQLKTIITSTMPELSSDITVCMSKYLKGDLRKLSSFQNIYNKDPKILQGKSLQTIFHPKTYSADTKEITKHLLNSKIDITQHHTIMNETDRTIVGLLWHENIIDVLSKIPCDKAFPFYMRALENICEADYIDRITFQKQIWQFNEMSSLIKTFYNNKIFHETFPSAPKFNPADVRFTKVLTKYSTEYNNSIFINGLCQQLGMDKKDVLSFFLELRLKHTIDEIIKLLMPHDIAKLDINRIYRYIDNYTLFAK